MEKRRIYTGLGVLCILLVAIMFVYQSNKVEVEELYIPASEEEWERVDKENRQLEYEIGKARGEWIRENGGMPDPGGEIYAKGKTVQVSKAEYEYSFTKYKVQGNEEEAEEKIVRAWARAKLLYNLAVEKGYSVTDEEVIQGIERAKEHNKLYEENNEIKSPMTAEMEGFDSEQEYWDAVYLIYQRDLTINKYTDDLREQKAIEWGLQDSFFELEEKWREYYDEYTKQLIEEEDVRIL